MNKLVKSLGTLSLACACSAGSAGTMILDPANHAVGVGDSFDMAVKGTGFAEAIVGGGFDLVFDAGVLQLTNVSVAPIWEFAPDPGVSDNVSGTLTDASFNTFASPRSGDFDVAVLSFMATSKGSSNVTLGPSATFVFADKDANLVTPTFSGGNVQVVDEASTVTMLLVGLGMLSATLRRKQ